MKKILVPVDFSQESSDALDFAIQFNEKIKGEIILLHVIELPHYSFNTEGEINWQHPEDFLEAQLIKGAHNHLTKWSERVSSAGQTVKIKMKQGHPYKHISKEIAEVKANWIVQGSKGASGLKEIFLGSNAERVIRYAECPVITIKGPTKISEMKNMVFASDLSEEQDWVALKAKEVQELFGLNMHLLKVRTPHNFLTAKDAEKQLEDFAKRNYLENFTLNSIEADYSDQGVVAFAEKVGAGLIVIGTHGKTGLAHFFGGSRAEDLVNESKIPVITFKLPFYE
ncbi:MAG: universal stress protein [Ekhidna sp.]